MENKKNSNIDIEKERVIALLADELNKDRLAIFLGAGCSTMAGLPTWAALIDDLIEKYSIKSNQKDLMILASMIESKIGKASFREQISDKFKTDPKSKIPLFEKVVASGVNLFITTNYDHLLENSFRRYGIDPNVISQFEDIPSINPTNKTIVKLHGDINSPTSLVITSDDYRKYPTQKRQFVDWFNSKLAEKAILFIGTSFEDPRLKRAEEHVFSLFGDFRRKSYIFLREPDSGNEVDIEDFKWRCDDFRLKNIHVIKVKTYDEIVDYLDQIRIKSAIQNRTGQPDSLESEILLIKDYATSLEDKIQGATDRECARLINDVRGDDFPLTVALRLKRAESLFNYIVDNSSTLSNEIRCEGLLVAADAFANVENKRLEARKVFDDANAVFNKLMPTLTDIRKLELIERFKRVRSKLLFFEGKVDEAIDSLSDSKDDKTIAFRLALFIDSDQFDKAYDLIKENGVKAQWVSQALYVLIYTGHIEEAEAAFKKATNEFEAARNHGTDLKQTEFKNLSFRDSICNAMASGFISRMFFLSGKKHGDVLTFAEINNETLGYCRNALKYLDDFFSNAQSTDVSVSHMALGARHAEMMVSELLSDLKRADNAAKELLKCEPVDKELLSYILRRGGGWDKKVLKTVTKRVLKDYKGTFFGYFNAAVITSQSIGDQPEAWDLFQKAIKSAITREDFDRLVMSAIGIGVATGYVEESVSLVADILPSDDQSKEFLHAEFAACNGDDDVAEATLVALEANNPPARLFAGIKFRRADIALRKGDREKAKILFEESNQLVFNINTLEGLLHVLTLMQDDSAALRVAEQLESYNPKDWESIRIKAQTSRNLGFYKKSHDAFIVLTKQFPEKPQYAYWLAEVLCRQFEFDKALDALSRFIQKDGSFNINCLQLAASAYALRNQKGDDKNAFDLLDKFYDIIMDNYPLLFMYMDLAYKTGNQAGSDKATERILQLKDEGKIPDNALKKVSIDEIKRISAERRSHKVDLNDAYRKGQLPRQWLCERNNMPVYLDWAVRTQELKLPRDPQEWVDYTTYSTNGLGVLPASSGVSKFIPITAPDADEIAIDLHALITLHRLGLLEKLRRRYAKVYYPANLKMFLKSEESKLTFPQKTREVVLRKLAERLGLGTIKNVKTLHEEESDKDKRNLAVAEREKFPLIDDYVTDEEIKDYPSAVVIRLSQLAQWLFEKGRIDEEKYSQIKRISNGSGKKNPTNDFTGVLDDKYKVLVELITLEQMEQDDLISILLDMGVQIFVEDAIARTIKHSVLEIDFHGNVGEWQRGLFDCLNRHAYFEDVSMPVGNRASKDRETSIDMLTGIISFANDKKIYLLTDDRTTHICEIQGGFYNRFSTDVFLQDLYDKNVIDIDEYASAFLQLCSWRYRFLLPDLRILLHLAEKYRNHPPGRSLESIKGYFSQCMDDLGLFLGFEQMDPPLPLGVKYYMTVSDIWIDFLVEIWKKDDFCSKSNLEKFTKWVLYVAYPEPPKAIHPDIRRNFINTRRLSLPLGLFIKCVIGTNEPYRYHELLASAFDSLNFNEKEREEALLNMLDSLDTKAFNDIANEYDSGKIKRSYAIKTLQFYQGQKEIGEFNFAGRSLNEKLVSMGLLTVTDAKLDPDVEEKISKAFDHEKTGRKNISEYIPNVPAGPLLLMEEKENKISILSADDLISAPSALVRTRTVKFLLSDCANFLLSATKELIEKNIEKIKSDDAMIWAPASDEVKNALLYDFKHSCQFLLQAFKLNNKELVKRAFEFVLKPNMEAFANDLPDVIQYQAEQEDIVSKLNAKFAGLSRHEDVLDKFLSSIYFIPFSGSLFPWNFIENTPPFSNLDATDRRDIKAIFASVKNWTINHPDPFANLIALDIVLNIRRQADSGDNFFKSDAFFSFLDELLEPLVVTKANDSTYKTSELVKVVWQIRSSLAKYYLQYMDLNSKLDLSDERVVAMAWWMSQKLTNIIIELVSPYSIEDKIAWLKSRASDISLVATQEVALKHLMLYKPEQMSTSRYFTLESARLLPRVMFSLLRPSQDSSEVEESAFYGLIYPTRVFSSKLIDRLIEGTKLYVLNGESQIYNQDTKSYSVSWDIPFGITFPAFLRKYYGEAFQYLGKDKVDSVMLLEYVSTPGFLEENLAKIEQLIADKQYDELALTFAALKINILMSGKMPEAAESLKGCTELPKELIKSNDTIEMVCLQLLIEIFKELQSIGDEAWLKVFDSLFSDVDYKNLPDDQINRIISHLVDLVLLGHNVSILDKLLIRAKHEGHGRTQFGKIKQQLYSIRDKMPIESRENIKELIKLLEDLPDSIGNLRHD